MAADPDPESEALIRKLHRELNGLTRRSRGHETVRIAGKAARRFIQSKKSLDSADGSEDFSEKLMHSKPSSEEERVSADQLAAPKPAKRDSDKERHVKAAKRSQHTTPGQAAHDGWKHQTANKAPQGPPLPPPVPLTPIEEAAVIASSMTTTRVKQGACILQTAGARLIKCFHAGIRWGVTLSPETMRHRSDLAIALNDAFAGQILSCGRGDMLHVVFLDDAGQVAEFPALRSDATEDAAQWRACVDRAVRVYVMR